MAEGNPSVKWTSAQRQVIDLERCNILVAAAAGSGKTAVLVERILRKMTQKENPVDIDRLLVVTFTRAAAAEMRKRLTEAVDGELERDPDNEHLQRQQTLIHHAQITTIDGFCSHVIRNYFHMIDLDPGFRVANEGEIQLLRQDVAKEVLEAAYGARTEAFDRFIETFATGKTDEGIIDRILELYTCAVSNPWPAEWLDGCLEGYRLAEAGDLEGLASGKWMDFLWSDVDAALREAGRLIDENRAAIRLPDGPYPYEEAVEADARILAALRKAADARDFDGMAACLADLSWTALSRKRDDAISETLRQRVREDRDRMKRLIASLGENYFYGTFAQVAREIAFSAGPAAELVRLVKAFAAAFAEKKRQKNLVDFSDIEHFALKILVKKEEGKLSYSAAADELADLFEEILIDEYQDSNLVQETILTSVSRLRRGQPNLFMVGDVKQSIYRFRLARPELFMEKYATYSTGDGPCRRIDLHQNFRSRPEVLAGVNEIFYQIMGPQLGGVAYDEAAALYPGAAFPPYGGEWKENAGFPATEILFAQSGELRDEGLDARELEARMIGLRIREIVGREPVYDREASGYRPARCGDCVILLRTVSGWAEPFVQVLAGMGIPASAATRTGYFSSPEVVTVLNYLHILDNPIQDLPFTGVLMSPVGGLGAQDLARVRAAYPDLFIHAAARRYGEEGEEGELREKLRAFFGIYDALREKIPYTPIHELIGALLKDTGYGNLVCAMPDGQKRRANLKMLVEKAMEYEGTSYHGLFHFLRYIEQLKKYQIDFGEAGMSDEQGDTVRVMSIHKSKGLEFPIVFVAGMGKSINFMDARSSFVIHQDFGIGMWAVDPARRVRTPTLPGRLIQRKISLESLGEELRILYVAMTRAKEKLILSGVADDLEKRIAAAAGLQCEKERLLPFALLASAKTWWDWILPAVARHPDFADFAGWKGREAPVRLSAPVTFRRVDAAEMVFDETVRQSVDGKLFEKFAHWDADAVYDRDLRRDLEEKFSYAYPYAYRQEIPAKISVSEFKRASQETEDAEKWYADGKENGAADGGDKKKPSARADDSGEYVPAFLSDAQKPAKGAARGTAYHTLLANLQYPQDLSAEDVNRCLDGLCARGLLGTGERAGISPSQIVRFASSYPGRRLAAAWRAGTLRREQPFVLSVPARECRPEWKDGEPVLIQGIIDAFWPEGDGWILLDYKTDRIREGEEEILTARYGVQLRLYSLAIERILGGKVKEMWLYSFALGKGIRVPEAPGNR